MLNELLNHLKNWFVLSDGIRTGRYHVESGGIELPFLLENQYFRICGSVFNDGVYQYPATGLTDEVFDGTVWALAIPKEILTLAEEIEVWQSKNSETSSSPYQSESFGGYSYTRASDPVTGGAVSWQTAFRSRLNKWRKI